MRGTGQSGVIPEMKFLIFLETSIAVRTGPAGDIIVRYRSGTNLDSGDPTKEYTARAV